MIETRGNNNILVVAGSAVPVEDIGDAILDRQNLDWICNRFPVSVPEVFECITVLADTNTYFKDGITLINRGSVEDILIETISVNEAVFFGLIDYGLTVTPGALDFDAIYNAGLIKVIEDVCLDLKNNVDHFEVSELHATVYKALKDEIGDFDPNLILGNDNISGVNPWKNQ